MTTANHGFTLSGLTKDKNPDLERKPFKKLTPDDIDFFKSVVGAEALLEPTDAPTNQYLSFTTDWYNIYRSEGNVVVIPETVEQVRQIVEYCGKEGIAIVPQSGNTSASGGSVPVFDEVIISTKKLVRIRHFSPLTGALVCDAGCNLAQLDEYLMPLGWQMPLDLPAKELCRIGGNVATNAGGIRLMRFGNLHGSIMGIEAVLADGTLLENLSTMRKDNTGYHLKNLFVGSEGTLGFITGVSIQTQRIRPSVSVLMLSLDSFERVVDAYKAVMERVPHLISAFEVMDLDSINVVKSRNLQVPNGSNLPISDKEPFYVIMEVAGAGSDQQTVDELIHHLKTTGIVSHIAVAQGQDERASIWSWRSNLPKAIVQTGPCSIHFDVSMSLPKLYSLVTDTRQWMRETGLLNDEKGQAGEIVAVYGYGHVGDGNLHLTIPARPKPGREEALRTQVDEFVYEWTAKNAGSISAEHGLGLMKAPYLAYTKPIPVIETMDRIKQLLDPKGIMNPYKVFPTTKQRVNGVKKVAGGYGCVCWDGVAV